jgi:DNA replication factor GINS
MTPEEELIYRQMISAVLQGREKILASITGSRTERPLTGRSDKAEEYAVVRLLNSVPTFIGVNGKRYILTKEDVVMIPAVHAKNLCDKGLAYDVKVKR